MFAEHVAIQRAVLERFPDALHILGSDTGRKRQEAVDAFQEEDGPQLIVCSLKAASQGITVSGRSAYRALAAAVGPSVRLGPAGAAASAA